MSAAEPTPLRVSLLLATVARTGEVQRFLESLTPLPGGGGVEIIVIDQNGDDRLTALLDRFRDDFEIRHIRSPRGLSRARNAGLALARGEIIAFPDDDCWFREGLLAEVCATFDRHPDWDGMTGRSVTGEGYVSGGRFDRHPGRVTLASVWTRGISYTIFLRRKVIEAVGPFDETLGLGAGTPFGSGEESDYLIRAIQAGQQIYYRPDLVVCHPDVTPRYDGSAFRRARSYGTGMGRVLRKHCYGLRPLARAIIRPAGGALVSLLTLRPNKARYHLNMVLGRIAGLMASAPDHSP